jgi:hypothetical protein
MGKKLNLIGVRFGYGIVLSEAENQRKDSKRSDRWWKLKCDCGKEYYATTHLLRVGDKKSCGCLYSPDLIGQKFGRGTVISDGGIWKKRRSWILQCECGNQYRVTTSHLKNGSTKSCGCIMHKPAWGSITSRIWTEITQRAKQRKKIFNITKEYAWNLFLEQNGKCALSGLDIGFAKTNYLHKVKRESTASLDRIDSSKDYIEGNVQWVHKHINSMKNSHEEKYFIELCQMVVNNKIKNNDI